MTPSAHVIFFGTTRLALPLDDSSSAKFRALRGLGPITTIAFSGDGGRSLVDEAQRFRLLPTPSSRLARYFVFCTRGAAALLSELLRGDAIKVVICQSPYEGAVAAGVSRVARLLGRRVACIVEAHGDFEEALFMYRRVRAPAIYRRVMRVIARRGLKGAAAVRAVSNTTARLVAAHVPNTPMVVFPAWMNLEIFRNAGDLQPTGDAHHIVFAGALAPVKGAHVLLEALPVVVERHSRVHVWICGHPENADYCLALRRRIDALGLEGRVTFMGHLDAPNLAKRMSKAGLVVVPSLSEGFGRIVVEAMAVGRPVVASAVGGLRETVADGESGLLVSPGDAAELSRAIVAILDDPLLALKMGAAGRQRAMAIGSPDGFAGGYQRLVRTAMPVA